MLKRYFGEMQFINFLKAFLFSPFVKTFEWSFSFYDKLNFFMQTIYESKSSIRLIPVISDRQLGDSLVKIGVNRLR